MAGPARPEPDPVALPPAGAAPQAEPDDAELLARHVAGDRAAFGVLVARHRDRLWAVAVRTLGDREEAADALQDALVSALRSAHTFQGRSAVTTWLHRIVVNACLDRARRAAVRRADSLDAPTGADHDRPALDSLVPPAEPAEAQVLRRELGREVSAALAELPPDQRAVLVLVDMQGYPVAEAAEVLGVPVGTVKSRCARGRARLLPLLRHLRSGPEDPPPQAAVPGGGVPHGGVSRETAPRETPHRRDPGNPNRPGPVPSPDPDRHEPTLEEGGATSR
ncbi:RNA polymerase sigma factor SigM [Kitasatospora viridis]|uniref:RNA polymerase ECF family sigma subunit n=1 Tax=Kitasatospora viridis TaxID=281105 RepID=A0A561UHJ0_9ACTN|nr:RNA polymerase sigma factor SigM [Kitasatospora viridis]TWF98815.1 RNA polymerase ECF family sigma subunit [Kitasatospora viridis]